MVIITINGPGGERSVRISDPDLVAELIAKNGDDVVNVVGYDGPTVAESDGADLAGLTVAQLRERADALGVEVKGNSKKADLVALLGDAAPAIPSEGDGEDGEPEADDEV